MSARIHHHTPTSCLASLENVNINIWLGAPSIDELRVLRERSRALVKEYPAGVVSMTVLMRGGRGLALTSEERRYTEDMAREFGPATRGIAHVIMGSGFFMATVRTVLSGISLTARTPYQTRVFENVADGASWLAPMAGGRITAASVRAATEEALVQVMPRAA